MASPLTTESKFNAYLAIRLRRSHHFCKWLLHDQPIGLQCLLASTTMNHAHSVNDCPLRKKAMIHQPPDCAYDLYTNLTILSCYDASLKDLSFQLPGWLPLDLCSLPTQLELPFFRHSYPDAPSSRPYCFCALLAGPTSWCDFFIPDNPKSQMQYAWRLFVYACMPCFLRHTPTLILPRLVPGRLEFKKQSIEIWLNRPREPLSSFRVSLQFVRLYLPTFSFFKRKSLPLRSVLHFHYQRMSKIVLSRNNIDFERKGSQFVFIIHHYNCKHNQKE